MSPRSSLARLTLAIFVLAAVAPTAVLARSGGTCAGGCGVINGGGVQQSRAVVNTQTTPIVAIAGVLIGQLAGAEQKPRNPGQASGSSGYYGPAPGGSGSGTGNPAKN